jgi:glycosyltransferase involved in cell wall biosynthesis
MKNKDVFSQYFDLLIITHLPAFYKINLYNGIAEHRKIYVLFIGSGSTIRLEDFTSGTINFEYSFLNNGSFEARNTLKSCIKTFSILRKLNFDGLIVNGWELPEFWLAIFFSRTRRGIALESTDFESNVKGFKRTLKKIFLSRLNFALPSGIPHQRLLKALEFHGDSAITGGVGFTSSTPSTPNSPTLRIYKALYIGRLSREKNLDFLIKVVNSLPDIELSIVGTGPELKALQEIAGSNINFYGHIDNSQLNNIFIDHHFLVLSSISETWGLVVEEALQSFLPVIVSDAVGCSEDLVVKLDTGVVFKSGSPNELNHAIWNMTQRSIYDGFVKNARAINWAQRRQCQITAYESLGVKSDYIYPTQF